MSDTPPIMPTGDLCWWLLLASVIFILGCCAIQKHDRKGDHPRKVDNGPMR